MHFVLLSIMTLALPDSAADEAAVVARLKQLGQVYVGYHSRSEKRVTRLDLRITGTREAKEVVAAMKELARLRHLETVLLMGPAFSDDAVKELAQVKTLRDVQLHRTQVTDAGIEALAALPELRRLVFWGSGLTDQGLKHLVRMKGLQYLEITDAPITNEGLEELRALSGLRRLSIVNSQATPKALRQLFQALPQLEAPQPNGLTNK